MNGRSLGIAFVVNAILLVLYLLYGGTFLTLFGILGSGFLGFLNAKAANLF